MTGKTNSYASNKKEELIVTVSQSTDARSMKVTLPDIDYTQYSAIYVKGEINLSQNDWIYLNNAVDTATGNVWFSANNGAGGGSTKYSNLDFDNMVFYPYPIYYADNSNFYLFGINNRNVTQMLTVTNREFYFVTYTSDTTILNTSQIEIYGVK